jgi:outer membrane lipoprotein SlyB
MLPISHLRRRVLMAQYFEQIMQSINNSEIRIALEKLFAIAGIGKGSQVGDPGFVGNLTGNVTGDVLGDVVGDVTGDVLGDITGDQIRVTSTKSVDEDMGDADTFATTLIDLDGTSASVALTKFTPTIGKTYVIFCSDASNAVTLTTSSGVTLDGTNDLATFDAADECIVITCINATTCLVVENIGGVVLS